MTLTFDLSPDQERQLCSEAEARGLAAGDLLRQLVLDALARMQSAAPVSARVPGLHAGHTRIDDDFDAPLPDRFWTGSE